MRVIGCDAGGDGALYELTFDPLTGWNPGDFLVMPMVDVGKRIREVDIPVVADWLLARPCTLFMIEAVGYMPSGVSADGAAGDSGSGFKGGGFGAAILTARYERLIGMLQTLRTIPFQSVRPSSWPTKLKIKVAKTPGETRPARKKRIKAATLAFVKQRYPTAILLPPRCRVPHEGLVDALAMAHYATVVVAENTPTLIR